MSVWGWCAILIMLVVIYCGVLVVTAGDPGCGWLFSCEGCGAPCCECGLECRCWLGMRGYT